MKKIMQHFLLLVVAAVMIVSCGKKTPQETKYIPKDASAVFVFDNKSMQDKLKKGNIVLDSVVKQIMGNDTLDTKDKELWNNLKEAGLDWEANVYVFLVQKASGIQSGQTTVINVMGGLKDAAKFEAFLKKEDKTKDKQVQKGKDYSYIVNETGSMVSWTAKNIIFTNYSTYERPVYDTVTNSFKYPDASGKTDAMKKEVDRYFTQNETESVASVTVFNDMFKEKGDMYAFTTSNGSLGMLGALPFQPPKLEELLKDNFTTIVANFDDGKVTAKSNFYPNKMLGALIDKYGSGALKTELLEHYPSQNVNGLLAFAFNPEIINGLIKEMALEGMVDGFLTKQGLSIAEITKAFKGDIAMAFSDFAMPAEPFGKPTYKFMVNITVGDKAAFTKLMSKAVETQMIIHNNGVYTLKPELAQGYYLHGDDKNIIITSDEATYNEYVAGKATIGVDKNVMSTFKGKSGAFFIDIEKLLAGMATSVRGAADKMAFDEVNKTFKHGIATSEKYSGKKMESVFEVKLKDEKQNSLVSISNMIINIAKYMKEKEKQAGMYDMNAVPDSATIISPSVEEKK